jgi:hypothetical protein
MKKIILGMSLFCTSFICNAESHRVPLIVEFSDGSELLTGEAIATMEFGQFEVSNSDGLSCSGMYDSTSQSTKLETTFLCSDGRFGKVSILRTGAYLQNGSGNGEMNDGTKLLTFTGDLVHTKLIEN